MGKGLATNGDSQGEADKGQGGAGATDEDGQGQETEEGETSEDDEGPNTRSNKKRRIVTSPEPGPSKKPLVQRPKAKGLDPGAVLALKNLVSTTQVNRGGRVGNGRGRGRGKGKGRAA